MKNGRECGGDGRAQTHARKDLCQLATRHESLAGPELCRGHDCCCFILNQKFILGSSPPSWPWSPPLSTGNPETHIAILHLCYAFWRCWSLWLLSWGVNKCLRLSQPGASSVGLSVNSVGPWLSHTPGAPVTSPLTQSGTLGISSFPVSSEVVHPRLSLQKNPISDYKIRNCGRYIIVYWAPSWSRNSFCRPSASYIFRAWYTLSPP